MLLKHGTGGVSEVPYLYLSHLGGFYTTGEKLDFDDRYCEDCGDTDDYIGEYKTQEDLDVLVARHEEG